jgi:hypothetical protein
MNNKSNTEKENNSECIEQESFKDKTEWKKLEFKRKSKLKRKKEI